MSFLRSSLLLVLLCCFLPCPLTGALIHRYQFNDAPGSTVVDDSKGSGDGELRGGGVFTGSELILDGAGGYVNLPNGMVSQRTNVTFEAWVTWQGGPGYQR